MVVLPCSTFPICSSALASETSPTWSAQMAGNLGDSSELPPEGDTAKMDALPSATDSWRNAKAALLKVDVANPGQDA